MEDRPRRAPEQPNRARTSQMVGCLRGSLLYSEKRVRDLLFRAIESLVTGGAGAPMILSRLIREAAALARKSAEESGFEFRHWETASRAVANAMLGASVLLSDDGQPPPAGIAAQATRIAALRANHRDLTEAYLLKVLIEKLGDVGARDHRALAHALFRQFDPRIPMDVFEDRVVILLATLADQVVLDDAGGYAVRPPATTQFHREEGAPAGPSPTLHEPAGP